MDSNTSPNPFLARNAIDDPERFFGRKMEIQQLYDNINSGGESGSPQCVSVVGERRIGKSSLLHYVAHPDIRKEHVDSALNCAFVQVDFSILGVNKEDITPKVFFQETLSSLEKELGLEFKVKPTYANFRSVVEELAEKYRILILIDEFDLLIHNDNFEPQFYWALRGLAQDPAYRLAFITASVKNLAELAESTKNEGSPFFNIFYPVRLQNFQEEEALELVKDGFDGLFNLNEQDIKLLFDLSGLHPLFLQIASSCMFEAKKENENLGPEDYESIVERFRDQVQIYNEDILKKLSYPERKVLYLTAKSKKIPDELSNVMTELENKGYIKEGEIPVLPFREQALKLKLANNRMRKLLKRNLPTLVILLVTIAIFVVSVKVEFKKLTDWTKLIGGWLIALAALLNNYNTLRQAFRRLSGRITKKLKKPDDKNAELQQGE